MFRPGWSTTGLSISVHCAEQLTVSLSMLSVVYGGQQVKYSINVHSSGWHVSVWSTMGHHMLTIVQLDLWSTTIMVCSFCVTVPGEEIQQTCSSLWIIPVFSCTCMYLCSFFLYFAKEPSRKNEIIYVFFNMKWIKWIPNGEAMSVYLTQ